MKTNLQFLLLLLSVLLCSCHEDGAIRVDERLGIGSYLYEEIDNSVNYNWYYDQTKSGRYSEANCGPASATMVIKWKNESWTKPVEYFRQSLSEQGEWWGVEQLVDSLKKYGVECYKKSFKLELAETGKFDRDNISNKNVLNILKKDLKYGNIIILCIDAYYLNENITGQWHHGRYYYVNEPKAGHFIIVKGYKETDTGLWLEVYDPYGEDKKYDDGGLKGVDRYHHIDDIANATYRWWRNCILVTR